MAAVTDPLYAIDPTSPAATGSAPGPAQPTPPLVLPSAAARTPAPAPAPSPSPGGFWRLLFAGPRALLLMPIHRASELYRQALSRTVSYARDAA